MKKIAALLLLSTHTSLTGFNTVSPVLTTTVTLKQCDQEQSPFANLKWRYLCQSSQHRFSSISMGYYGNYVKNRHMKLNDSNPIFHGLTHTKSTLKTDAALLKLTCAQRIDVFGLFGSTKYTLITNSFNSNPPLIFSGTSHHSWGIGATSLLFSFPSIGFGVNGLYFQTTPTMYTFNLAGIQQPIAPTKIAYREWQVGIGSALWFKLNKSNTCGVSPYISLNYAYATNGPLSDTTTSTSTAITLEQALSTLGLTITDLLNKGTDDQLSIIYYLVNQYPNFTQEMIYQTLYPNPPTVTTVSTNLIPISHNKSVGIGVEIGSTFQFSSMVHLNISTSLINQTAVTMTLQINL